MPFTARIPVVEFRSLLLPPIRVSLRTVQALYRPQHRPSAVRSPQCLAQRRSLVLWKTAKAETTLGQHTVLPFDRYLVADPAESAHLVTLVHGKKTIAENISLAEVYEKHVKPGQLLYLKDGIDKKLAERVSRMKDEETVLAHRTYGIVETGTIPGNKRSPDSGKGRGAFRVTPLTLASPPDYLMRSLDRSYQFIDHGAPVEFSFAIKRSPIKKEDKWKGIDDKESWPWIHEHFPHLRPDFILKSMPEGSMWSVEPVSDGRRLQFVIIKPSPLNKNPINYTSRLFKVKESVKKQIARGRAQQLPKSMRQELSDSGHETYSALSSMPIKRGSTSEERIKQSQAATEDWMMPDSKNRYAPIEKPRAPMRTDKLHNSGELRKGAGKFSKVGEWNVRMPGEGSAPPGHKKVQNVRKDEEEDEEEDQEEHEMVKILQGSSDRVSGKERYGGRKHGDRFDKRASGRDEERFDNRTRRDDDRLRSGDDQPPSTRSTSTEHTRRATTEEDDPSHTDDDGWSFKIRKHDVGVEGANIIKHDSLPPARIIKQDATERPRPRSVALSRGKTGTWSRREPVVKRRNDKYPPRTGERKGLKSHEKRQEARRYLQASGEEGGSGLDKIDSRGSGFGVRRTKRAGPSWSSRRSPES